MTTTAEALTAPDLEPSPIEFRPRLVEAHSFEERRARPYGQWWHVLLFMLPFAAVAASSLGDAPSEAHRQLIAGSAGSADHLSAQLIPSLLAALWPNNAWLVGIAVVAAGFVLRMLARGFVDRGLSGPLVCLLLAVAVSSPALHSLLAGDVALTLLWAVSLVALAGVLSFSGAHVTADGFFAGLALGVGVLVHPAAVWVGVGVAGWAFLAMWFRRRHEDDALSAGSAAATVVGFPALVAFLAIGCLAWAGGNGFQTPVWDALSMPDVASLRSAADTAGAALLVSPLYLVGAAISIGSVHRRPAAFAVHALPLLVVLIAGASGLELPREFAEALLLGTALLFLRPTVLVGQVDLALVAVLQGAVGIALATGQL